MRWAVYIMPATNAENVHPHSNACIPDPLSRLPLPVTYSATKIIIISAANGAIIFNILLSFCPSYEAAVCALDIWPSSLLTTLSNRPVVFALSSATFIDPISFPERMIKGTDNTAIKQ
ncbi:hypothetical protein SDC9_192788 [bioreactor metagenome]|uniref:Uncharacterized protein n=1 Tax=bioreactor metagenome TaxID=1076179 RepID=A0A645I1P7_9ZZZZ